MRRRNAHPWPDAWKNNHCMSWKRSFSSVTVNCFSLSYRSTRYRMIAHDSQSAKPPFAWSTSAGMRPFGFSAVNAGALCSPAARSR